MNIPAELVRRQIQAIQCAGYPSAPLRQLDLPDTLFAATPLAASATLELELAGQVFQRCKAITGDTTFGFSSGPGEPRQQALLLFLGTLDCPSLGTMLRKQGELVAYMQRHNEFALSLSESGEQTLASAGFARLSNPSTIPRAYLLASDVLHLFWWHQTYCWLINQTIGLKAVQLMGSEEEWSGIAQSLHSLFDAPIVFGQAHFAIQFDTHWLEKPLRRTGAEVEVFFSNIGKACKHIQRGRDTVSAVRQLLAANEGHRLGLQQASDALHMSRETLIRHLKAKNTSFQQLKDAQRSSLAVELLQQTAMSLADIADNLGFASGPAFTRACKRWLGATPSALRQQLSGSTTCTGSMDD